MWQPWYNGEYNVHRDRRTRLYNGKVSDQRAISEEVLKDTTLQLPAVVQTNWTYE